MQLIKKYLSITLCLVFIFFSSSAFSQSTNLTANEVAALVSDLRFSFVPKNVFSQSSKSQQITDEYKLSFSKDSIDSDLPYYGQAATATMDNSNDGIRFITTKFTYAVKDKEHNWEISIRPKNVNTVREMIFVIYGDGSARLTVLSNMRETISFDGNIQK